MYKVVYPGLDVHASVCILAAMDPSGFQISAKGFIGTGGHTDSSGRWGLCTVKYLAVEESFLAGWIANTLRRYQGVARGPLIW